MCSNNIKSVKLLKEWPVKLNASVVVTAFDRRESLKRLLGGLNAQTVSPDCFEVIIGDDSGDKNIAKQALNNISTIYNVSVIKTNLPYDVNGVSVARNLGINLAKGDIIISLDDDCLPNQYFIEEHLFAHANTYPKIVLGHRSEQPEKLYENRPVSITEDKAASELIAAASDQLNFMNFMTGNLSFPKDIAVDAGLFNETFAQQGEHGWEDIELGYRLWRLGYPTVFARNALVYRPPTEKEKEEKRSATDATQRAFGRFLRLHPLVPWVNQLLEARRQSKNVMAREIAQRILKEDPDNHGILTKLGEIYLAEADFENGLDCFSRASQINSLHPAVHEKVGEILYHQGLHEEALESFRRALELDANRTRSLYFLIFLRGHSLSFGVDAILSRDINVELGGGIFPTKIRQEKQDDYINLDVLKWPTVDVITDSRKPLPFPDESVNAIFSREMIEHLPYNSLPKLIQECFRVLKHGGTLYLCCPDFEALMDLYDKRCNCAVHGAAKSDCQNCNGNALISEEYWHQNLLGNQDDYGDGGVNDTHKNQITFPYLKSLLEAAGFERLERDRSNKFYEEHKRVVKLSVSCMKP